MIEMLKRYRATLTTAQDDIGLVGPNPGIAARCEVGLLRDVLKDRLATRERR